MFIYIHIHILQWMQKYCGNCIYHKHIYLYICTWTGSICIYIYTYAQTNMYLLIFVNLYKGVYLHTCIYIIYIYI